MADTSTKNFDSRDFSDHSNTSIVTTDSRQSNTTDSRQYSTVDNSHTENIDSRNFSDNSQTTVNTSDNRVTNNTDARQTNTTDSRSFIDNSVHNTLDASVAQAAIESAAAASASSNDSMEKAFLTANETDRILIQSNARVAKDSIETQQAATQAALNAQGHTVDGAISAIGHVFDGSLSAVGSAYANAAEKSQSADTQLSTNLLKYGTAAAAIAAALFIFRRK